MKEGLKYLKAPGVTTAMGIHSVHCDICDVYISSGLNVINIVF